MKENEDTVRALTLMLEYLKDRQKEHVEGFRDADAKASIKLTINGGLLGLITFSVPVLMHPGTPWVLLVAAALLLTAFGYCLMRMLLFIYLVLWTRLDVPGVDRAALEKAARYEGLLSIPILQNLVTNYAMAVESNLKTFNVERKPELDGLNRWNKRTLIAGFAVVAYLGVVAVGERVWSSGKETAMAEDHGKAGKEPAQSAESPVAEAKPAPSPVGEAKPAQSPVAEAKPTEKPAGAQPSIVTAPDRIEAGVPPSKGRGGLEKHQPPVRTSENTPKQK